ncbi:MAG: methyl-accepting chemotaxis protein [Desulfobacterales bacterium]|nr:methyl-accepting chemotaxis protein [Desulfobacterales bacterium]MBF0395855.1 methyl-accepting chemotaxis protein [Desulfobacterales bacterium]
MKIHNKLIFSVLSGLIIIVIFAQVFQFSSANQIISNLSKEAMVIAQERGKQAAFNLFHSIEQAIYHLHERGEIERLKGFLQDQNFEGFLDLSIYNKDGRVSYSSNTSLINKPMPKDIQQRLLSNPELYFQRINNVIEIHNPQVVKNICLSCHKKWKIGEICGAISLRYSLVASEKIEQKLSEAQIKNRKTFIINSIFTLIGIIIVFTGLMYWSASEFIKNPLNKIIDSLKDISEGEGDLTKRLNVYSDDELGTLAKLFNIFIEKLQLMIQQIQKSGIQITSSSAELYSTAKKQELIMKSQVESTDNVMNSVKEIASVNKDLAQTIKDVTSTETEGKEITNLAKMAQAMHIMEDASISISEKLTKINEKAENITDVVTTIRKVADQTNLLSLNAAIEAEKAGEYGRGFTVVAREIRRLADQTAISTMDIEKMVKEMQSAVNSGVTGMDNFIREVRKNAEDVKRISSKLFQIISEVHSLYPRFNEVNNSMINLNEETHKTKNSLLETYSAIENLNDAAQQLHDEVIRFKVKKN